MNSDFKSITEGIRSCIEEWEPKLMALNHETICGQSNAQNRNIKQLVGHMIDSASNNTHRFVHLQYQDSPLRFPNYATHGNNDRWIAIQNYEAANWADLVQLWKYSNLHVIHVINNVDKSKLANTWHYSEVRLISLEEMIIDYLRHLKLHLDEIDELIHP